MAQLMAVTLGENRVAINQEIDSEFFDDFKAELDIESLVIGGEEFASMLSSPKVIKQYIEEIEESTELPYPLEVYIASIKLYSTKDTDFDTVREHVENYYQSSMEKDVMVDPCEEFAKEKALEWLEMFNTPHVSKDAFNTLINHFDFDAYQTTLFTNDYDAVDTGESVHFFAKG